MKTECKEVTGQVAVWAIPTSQWMRENYPENGLFTYELRVGHSYETGAVKVVEQEVSLTVPAGINLVEKAIETLEAAKEARRKDYYDELNRLDAMISSLLMLEAPKPQEDCIEGQVESRLDGTLA